MPDKRSKIADTYGIDNVNINGGLMEIKMKEIMDLVEEFPTSDGFNCSNEKLCRKYNSVRAKLMQHISAVKREKERLETLEQLHKRISRIIEHDAKDNMDASFRLVGNIKLMQRTELLTNMLARELEKPEVSKKLREKMLKNLDKL